MKRIISRTWSRQIVRPRPESSRRSDPFSHRRLSCEWLEDRRLLSQGVSGRVWSDENNNGLQDPGEPGEFRTVVEAFSTVDNVIGNADDSPFALALTDMQGQYRLSGFAAGTSYYLAFRGPAGLTFTVPNAGDEAIDSDVSAAGLTGIFTIAPGQDDIDVDAGMTGPWIGNVQAVAVGGAQSDGGNAVVIDPEGNAIVGGIFQRSADFDPGPGTYPLTSAGYNSSFVAKYLANGALLWARGFSGVDVWVDLSGLAATPDGGAVATGSFGGTVDFDPGPGTFPLTASTEGPSSFLLRLDSAGQLVWAEAFTAAGGRGLTSQVATGPDGIWLAGQYDGAWDADPGAGTTLLTSAGGTDIYVAKLSWDGTPVWAGCMGGTSSEDFGAIAAGPDGGAILTGGFRGTADFDPGAAVSPLASIGERDVFVVRLGADGSLIWAEGVGGPRNDLGQAVAVGADGTVVVGGSFQQSVDFDPGPGDASRFAWGGVDLFVWKLNADGSFLWVQTLHGPQNESLTGIQVAPYGAVTVTGVFRETLSFDRGGYPLQLTSSGGSDLFIATFNAGGMGLWAGTMGGAQSEWSGGLAVGPGGVVYLTGFFRGTGDFNPLACELPLTSAGGTDAFLVRLERPFVGDFVWNDINGNGLQDSGEPGIAGVAVEMFATADLIYGNEDDVSYGVRVTDASGHYQFQVDPNLSYYIVVRPPAIYYPTTQSVGVTGLFGVELSDSDFDWAGRSPIFTVHPGDVQYGYDAGFRGGDPSFGLLETLNGADLTFGSSLTTDSAGNLYLCGAFQGGTVDVDPGPGYCNLAFETRSSFVAKYSPTGALIWMRSYEDRYLLRVATGPDDGIYVSGDNATGMFVEKFDTAGNRIWTRSLDGSGDCYISGIAFDGNRNVYLAGDFSGSVDFDPGPAERQLTATGDSYDIFLASLTDDGDLRWAERIGGAERDMAWNLVAAGGGTAGALWLTGNFAGSVDFDPGPGDFTIGSVNGSWDAFVCGFDLQGNLLRAAAFGGPYVDQATDLALPPDGALIVTGVFAGTADFDPGPGESPLASQGGADVFVVRLEGDGRLGWARSFGGAEYEVPRGIDIAPDGRVLITGAFQGTVNFNTGGSSGSWLRTSLGGDDAFRVVLDAAGNMTDCDTRGTSGDDRGDDIHSCPDGSQWVSGQFAPGTHDFFLWQIRPGALVGGRVWQDTNGNGVQDTGEPGLGGATVEVFSSQDALIGNGDDVLHGQVTTNPDGTYALFMNSDVNAYLVFHLPPGYAFTGSDAGGDDALDSDADSIGRTGLFRVSTGQDDFSRSAGVRDGSPAFGYAWNGNGEEWGGASAMAVDGVGNLYLAGWADETADLDPGPGVVHSPGEFLASYTAAGALRWVRQLSGSALTLAVTADGGVVVSGCFWETVDFDPGVGTVNLDSRGLSDGFVCRFDAWGNFLWVRAIQGWGDEYIYGAAAGSDGSIVISGMFTGTADFDPGEGEYLLSSVEDSFDAFVCKLDAAGNFLWARSLGGPSADQAYDVAMGPDGSVFVCGAFNGTVDFDPGPGTFNLTGSVGFLWKLDAAGNFAAAQVVGQSSSHVALVLDLRAGTYEVCAAGSFRETSAFGNLFLTSAGGYDAFVVRFDSELNPIWARSIGGPNDEYADQIAVGPGEEVVTTGVFSGIVDFDSEGGIFTVASAGEDDGFVCIIDGDGAFRTAWSVGGPRSDYITGLALGPSGCIYLAGSFLETVDVRPGAGSYTLSAPHVQDFFVAKVLNPNVNSYNDTIGVYDPGGSNFFLAAGNASGPADIVFNFGIGAAGFVPLAGDWNGDGVDTVGLYLPETGAFFLRDTHSPGPADNAFIFGVGGAGWLPIAGDWDGDGDDTVGLYAPETSTFYLKNSHSGGDADLMFSFGVGGLGWLPIAGDWDGDGRDGVGLYAPKLIFGSLEVDSVFFLKNSAEAGPADELFQFGVANTTWQPLAGDWDGESGDGVGFYVPETAQFFLKDAHTNGAAETAFVYGIAGQGWRPLVGCWSFPMHLAEAPSPAAVDRIDLATLAAHQLQADFSDDNFDLLFDTLGYRRGRNGSRR